MAERFGMVVNSVVKQSDVIGISDTAIFRAPTWARPGQSILQQPLKYHASDLTMSQKPLFMLVQIGLFMHLKIVEIRVLDLVLLQQRLTPTFGPVAEHLFIQRACPPFDHAAFVDQTA